MAPQSARVQSQRGALLRVYTVPRMPSPTACETSRSPDSTFSSWTASSSQRVLRSPALLSRMVAAEYKRWDCGLLALTVEHHERVVVARDMLAKDLRSPLAI